MLKRILYIVVSAFAFLQSVNLYAQPSYETLLNELQKEEPNLFYKVEDGEYVVSYELEGESTKMFIKDFELFENSEVKCGTILLPIISLSEGYVPTKSLLNTLMTINVNCAPGLLMMVDDAYIVYVSYFWKEELSKDVLGYEIFTAVNNSIIYGAEITEFINNEME